MGLEKALVIVFPPHHQDEWIAKTFPSLECVTALGQGGQKAVFSATHATHGSVVLKLFHLASNADRAAREVEAIRAIKTKYVPCIYEFGSTTTPAGDILWLIEQHVPGITLRELLQTGPLKHSDVVWLAEKILEAIVAAERANIVHRDIKPDNIVVDLHARTAWLIDFGIARHLDLVSLTATMDPFGVGTPGYASPEQFRNLKDDIDCRSDLFSLGITLYETAVGRNPFLEAAQDWREVMRRTEQEPLKGLNEMGALGQFIAALTGKRRDHRLPNASLALQWILELGGKTT